QYLHKPALRGSVGPFWYRQPVCAGKPERCGQSEYSAEAEGLQPRLCESSSKFRHCLEPKVRERILAVDLWERQDRVPRRVFDQLLQRGHARIWKSRRCESRPDPEHLTFAGRPWILPGRAVAQFAAASGAGLSSELRVPLTDFVIH